MYGYQGFFMLNRIIKNKAFKETADEERKTFIICHIMRKENIFSFRITVFSFTANQRIKLFNLQPQ